MSQFNNLTNLHEDQCAIDSMDIMNEDVYKYNIPNFEVNRVNNSSRNSYFASLDNLGMFEDNKDSYFKNMPAESALRDGAKGNVITNTGCRASKQVYTSQYTYPFQGYRYPDDAKIDTYSRLVNGNLTHDKTSTRGVSIDRFIPLIPAIKQEVQNVAHIIPKYWVNGGMDTRSVIRNIDYLKSCGIKSVNH